jgi:hypothetical protein
MRQERSSADFRNRYGRPRPQASQNQNDFIPAEAKFSEVIFVNFSLATMVAYRAEM